LLQARAGRARRRSGRLRTHVVLGLDVGARLQQHARNLQLAVRSGEVKRRPPVLVRHAHVRLVVQQQAHHVQVAPAACLVQRGVAELVHDAHICATLQQQLHHRQVVVHGCVVQRSAAILRGRGVSRRGAA
jgi:hypothetical protein